MGAWTRHSAWLMMRHPAFLLGTVALMTVWAVTAAGDDAYPSLTQMSWAVQLPLLILVGATYFSALLTALAPYRFATSHWERAHPLPHWGVVLGQLLAVLAPAGIVCALAFLRVFVAAQRDSAVGAPLPVEFLVIGAATVLAGVTGVTAAHVGRSLSPGVLVFVGLAIACVAGVVTQRPWRWLTLIAPESSFVVPPAPSSAIARPAVAHLVWLLSLAVGLAVILLAAVGARRSLCVLLAVGCCLAAVWSARVQLTRPATMATRQWASVDDAASHCRSVRAATYCALDEFGARIPVWAAVVDKQLAAIPPTPPRATIVVRQHLPPQDLDGSGYRIPAGWSRPDTGGGVPVLVSTRWAAPGTDSFDQTQVLSLALSVAYSIVYGQTPPIPPEGGGTIELCGGRGVAALWLAAATTEEGRSALDVISRHSSLTTVPIADSAVSLTVGHREGEVVQRLLLDGGSAEAVQRNWTTLLDDQTSVERAAQALGVASVGPPPEGSGLCQ